MKNGVLLTTTLLGSLLINAQAVAGASSNIGVTSNYIWRGITQTQDTGAIQAGLDYSAENGLYVGTWASNSKFAAGSGAEIDLYAGYKKELPNGMTYDMGVIKYFYPDNNSVEFAETYGKIGYKGISAEIDYTIDKVGTSTDEGDVYVGLGYSGELNNGVGYGVKTGRYNVDGSTASDYNNYEATLTKGDFTLGVSKATSNAKNFSDDLKADDTKAYVSWKKSFDF